MRRWVLSNHAVEKKKAGVTGQKTGLLGLEPSAPVSQTPTNKALASPPSCVRTKYDTKCARQTPDDADLAPAQGDAR
jgi:hypothetical protein